MKAPPYTITNESITVIWDGKSHTVQKGSPQFKSLSKVIYSESWDELPKYLTVTNSLETWAKGKFKFDGKAFSYDGKNLRLTLVIVLSKWQRQMKTRHRYLSSGKGSS
jgi:hypothetical protein